MSTKQKNLNGNDKATKAMPKAQSKAVSPNKGKDTLVWIVVIALLVAGIVANSVFSEIAGPVRIAGFIVLVVVLMLIAGMTDQGKSAWGFIKASRSEMRRVVWPTRQETVQTTMLIIGVVLVAALILWLFDSLFLMLIRMIISV